MTERRPQPGELYMHFKKKMYQVIAVARHSETGEELVVYQALYGDYSIYARPLAMFVNEVDTEKYPEVSQKYRFEKVDREGLEPAGIADGAQQDAERSENTEQCGQPAEAPTGEEADIADPRLLRFLDADTYHEKYKVLAAMEEDITDRLINDFAVILDVVIPEGALSNRFEQLKQSVATMAKYETTRLR